MEMDGAEASAAAVSTVPSWKVRQLKESLMLEHQLLRVSFEQYERTIQVNQNAVKDEISSIISALDDSFNTFSCPTVLVSRVQGLKRKFEEGRRAEDLQKRRFLARLEHLESAGAENLAEWNDTRLKRILIDYLVRMSYFKTAKMLAESSNVQDLVDIDIFEQVQKPIDAFRKKELAPILSWCADNRSLLEKYKSKVEYVFRVHEFIEFVRADTAESYKNAILYAQKHLAPLGTNYMTLLKRIMATLAFKSNTNIEKYKVLLAPEQWDSSLYYFKREFCKLHGLALKPLLNIYLQAGISALKTTSCSNGVCPKEDPLSQESFQKLASRLPLTRHPRSNLVCYITKKPMDSTNRLVAFPNGYVYSMEGLQETTRKTDDDVTCPRTGLCCSISSLSVVYV